MNEVSVDKTNQAPLRQAPVDLNPASCCAAAPAAFTAQPEDDERLAALCKALAHPHRVHILRVRRADAGGRCLV